MAEFRNRNGRGVDVKLENGETLAADFAVLSVGVVPNIELAAEAGIQMGATLEDLLSYQYATFKKCCDIFNNHHKIAPPHTDKLRRVKLSKFNYFGLMTKS